MTPRLLRILLLAVLGTAVLLPPLESGYVLAQGGGRNVFENRRSGSSPSKPRPKADEATRERLNQTFQQEFNTGLGDVRSYLYYAVFLVFLGVLIGILAYYDYNTRQKNKSGIDNPKSLFRELCAAHRLTAGERKFLRDFAEDHDLDDPLPLFIEPRYFYEALEEKQAEPAGQMIRYLLIKLFDIKLVREDHSKNSLKSPPYSSSGDRHSQTTILVPSISGKK